MTAFDRLVEDMSSLRLILWVASFVLTYFGVISFLN